MKLSTSSTQLAGGFLLLMRMSIRGKAAGMAQAGHATEASGLHMWNTLYQLRWLEERGLCIGGKSRSWGLLRREDFAVMRMGVC